MCGGDLRGRRPEDVERERVEVADEVFEREQRRDREAEMTPVDDSHRRAKLEAELARAAALVEAVVSERLAGDRDPLRGNSDDDLLGAVDALEGAIRSWRPKRVIR